MISVTLEPAAVEDAATLTEISRRSFDDDAVAWRGGRGGPPGYDSIEWQSKQILRGGYFRILENGRIVGGAIVTPFEDGVMELSRIYVDTDRQNAGIGRQAMHLIHALFPAAKAWQLDTPEWAVRNHYFYESLGYRRVGVQPTEGFDLILYERSGT